MKHLVAKEHHPHLKKRAYLEFAGLLLLLLLSYHQREVILTSLQAIRSSDVLYLFLLLAAYWVLLPLTPISYRLLSERKIPLITTILAQLAASGPGRIIPGGLGHVSIGSIHLHKSGLKIQQAIVVSVANNIIGLGVNLSLVIIAIIYHPVFLQTVFDNISTRTLLVFFVALTIAASLILWLSHVRSTRKTINKVNKQWKYLVAHLIKNPHRLFTILLIAITVTLGHTLMLLLAGAALDVHISPTDALIALSAGVFIGGTIPTPGGLGAVEAGTTSALIVLGYDATQATSVAILFRTATYFQPLLPGVFAYLYLRDKKLL